MTGFYGFCLKAKAIIWPWLSESGRGCLDLAVLHVAYSLGSGPQNTRTKRDIYDLKGFQPTGSLRPEGSAHPPRTSREPPEDPRHAWERPAAEQLSHNS